MQSPSVAVLMSTYNPDPAYFAQQMQSLYDQTYPVSIFIRDDGSSSAPAIEAIKQAETQDNVSVVWGENKGYGPSFLSLLNCATGFDFYAFCDQDDVWLPEKVERGVSAICHCGAQEPVLYFSHYDFYDKDMNFLSHSAFEGRETPLSFRNALVDVNILGMTMLFNERLRQLMIRCDECELVSHDWWAYLVAAGCGRIVEDTQVTVRYRRHGDNSSGVGDNVFKRLWFRIDRFLLHDTLREVRRQIREFYKSLGARISDENRKVLSLFLPGHRVRKALIKIGYPGKWRLTVADDLQCRLMFFLGRL